MSSEFLALEALVADIAVFAKKQIDSANLSGPRFGAYVKLAWFGQAGDPCHSDCQNIIDALQLLRDLDDNSEIDTFYVAMTASSMGCFPNIENVPGDFDAIRRMSAQLRHVA
ncbi:hypothetical protein [Cohaesibacter celericrescens]|uniref:hypothetical protein n=1 Tax=Cohaesibacter celericrescens TaxID=2067669 RepID=UPI003565AFA9